MCTHWTDVRQSLVPDGCMRVPLLQPKRDMGACREVHLHHHHPHRSFVPCDRIAGSIAVRKMNYSTDLVQANDVQVNSSPLLS